MEMAGALRRVTEFSVVGTGDNLRKLQRSERQKGSAVQLRSRPIILRLPSTGSGGVGAGVDNNNSSSGTETTTNNDRQTLH